MNTTMTATHSTQVAQVAQAAQTPGKTFTWYLTCHRKHCKTVSRVALRAARDTTTGKTGTVITSPDGTPVLFCRDLAHRSAFHDRNATAGTEARTIHEAALHSGMVCACGNYLTGYKATRLESTVTAAPCTSRCRTAVSTTCRCECGGTLHGVESPVRRRRRAA